MRASERLQIITEKDQVTEVHFDPKAFSFRALREIFRFRMFDDEPKDLVMIVGRVEVIMQHDTLVQNRTLRDNELRKFLDLYANEMGRSDEVIIRSGSKSPSNSRTFPTKNP